jgi:hypothetical protein
MSLATVASASTDCSYEDQGQDVFWLHSVLEYACSMIHLSAHGVHEHCDVCWRDGYPRCHAARTRVSIDYCNALPAVTTCCGTWDLLQITVASAGLARAWTPRSP